MEHHHPPWPGDLVSVEKSPARVRRRAPEAELRAPAQPAGTQLTLQQGGDFLELGVVLLARGEKRAGVGNPEVGNICKTRLTCIYIYIYIYVYMYIYIYNTHYTWHSDEQYTDLFDIIDEL